MPHHWCVEESSDAKDVNVARDFVDVVVTSRAESQPKAKDAITVRVPILRVSKGIAPETELFMKKAKRCIADDKNALAKKAR